MARCLSASLLVACLVCVAWMPLLANGNCLTTAGLTLITSSEGFSSTFYNDAVGVRTIGYGTACTAYDCSTISAPITQATASAIMLGDINAHYAPCVTNAVKVTINNNQFSALVSFVYNLGCASLTGSTLLKDLNSGLTSEVPAQFLRWNKAGGNVLPGLTTRRQNEANMFSSTAASSCASGASSSSGSSGSTPTSAPTSAPTSTACAYNGQAGTCGPVASCTGTAHTGLCPGASYIQCCVPTATTTTTDYGTCTASGVSGICKDSTTCTSSGGKATAGLCSGPSNIQCCTVPAATSAPSCVVGSASGSCIDVSLCAGSATAGYCAGASNIQCCIIPEGDSIGLDTASAPTPPVFTPPSTVTTTGQCVMPGNSTVAAQAGWCMAASSCAVSTSSGLCGATTAGCCSYPTCTLSSGTVGTCMPSSSCSGQNGVSTSGVCSGSSDIKCCTWPTSNSTCNIAIVNNCLMYGGSAATCYSNSGCVQPTNVLISDTTNQYPSSGAVAHGSFDNVDAGVSAATSQRASSVVIATLLVAVVASIGARN